jgi:ABC-type polysaccharide/polyol phosphate export permease
MLAVKDSLMPQHALKRINRKNVAEDIVEAIKLYRTWAYLSYQDVISRYRRSILGPFWVAAIMITQSVALSLVFGGIYNIELREFLPYVIAGLTVFNYIGSAFGEGAETFAIYRSVVTAYNMPLSFHIMRMCCRQFVIFLHNFVVFIVVMAVFSRAFTITPMLIPALFVAFVFLFSCTLINATLSLRFRDYKFILPHVWTIVFYFTPVIWRPNQISEHLSFLYVYNPIYYILEIMRGSMLGTPVGLEVWLGATGVATGAAAIAYLVFATMRKKIALWL